MTGGNVNTSTGQEVAEKKVFLVCEDGRVNVRKSSITAVMKKGLDVIVITYPSGMAVKIKSFTKEAEMDKFVEDLVAELSDG